MKPTVKRIPKEKVAILHVCEQRDNIAKLNLILVGNGHPEEGYVYKVVEMSKEIKNINDKLTGINGIVKELHEKSIGRNAVERKKKINWARTIQLISAFTALGMLYLGYKNLTKELKAETTALKHEIRLQEGVSKVTRGGYVKYNDHGLSDSIKITR